MSLKTVVRRIFGLNHKYYFIIVGQFLPFFLVNGKNTEYNFVHSNIVISHKSRILVILKLWHILKLFHFVCFPQLCVPIGSVYILLSPRRPVTLI